MNNGSMKVKLHPADQLGPRYITPVTQAELFEHCNGGYKAANYNKFHEAVKPLLLTHGIKEIKFI